MVSYTSMPAVETSPCSRFIEKAKSKSATRVIALLVFLAAVVITVVILQLTINPSPKGGNGVLKTTSTRPVQRCTEHCTIGLVESIPEGVVYPDGSPQHPSIYEGWMNLIEIAEETIDIASFYWTLRGTDTKTKDPSSKPGENVYKGLVDAAQKRGIKIRIVQIPPSKTYPNLDTLAFQQLGVAEVRNLNMARLVGGGIIHTKMWLVDKKHFYVGSANLDWRALTQIQELGLMTYNCSCMGLDMAKIFDVYWDLALPHSKIPDPWPEKYHTDTNLETPAEIIVNGTDRAQMFLASAPPKFCPPGRTDDLSAILHTIRSATKFVYVAVMDYFPTSLYSYPRSYWPVIDDELRKAAFDRGVNVKLMGSLWNNTRSDMKNYLQSLAALNTANGASIEVKLFKVPGTPQQAEIPYARVNHNKFMVTEQVAYVGTSNWSEDYFLDTAGLSHIINDTLIQAQLQAVFERNWNSSYTIPVL